jgi:hypothetical protein
LADDASSPAAWQQALRNHAFVRIHAPGQDNTGIHGVTSQRVALELMNMQFGIEFLGEADLPLSHDLFPPRDALGRPAAYPSNRGAALSSPAIGDSSPRGG